MPSLAEFPDLVGFFSYSREDDQGSGERLSKLRERIQEELRLQLGRTKRDFRLWQDKVAIAHGELWEDRIKKAVSESAFFIPIVTPTAARSSYCKFEFESFLARERELDRNNLIFPILYVQIPALSDDRWRQDPLLSIVGSRQYEDWQNLRHLDASSAEVALRIEKFCTNICRALEQEWLSPEERQQAEARRVAEGEHRRQQEAEIKHGADEEQRQRKAEAEERRRDQEERRRQEAEDRRRLAEAEAQKGRQDEERRRLEKVAKLAAKEEQRRKRLEQEPQQPVKPWLLPLIGAGAAVSLFGASIGPLLVATYGVADLELLSLNVLVVATIDALYGGAVGILVQRLGIPKALAIPIIPSFLLLLAVNFEGLFLLPIVNPVVGLIAPNSFLHTDLVLGLDLIPKLLTSASLLVPAVIGAGLAFWLHSLWARKQRLREAAST